MKDTLICTVGASLNFSDVIDAESIEEANEIKVAKQLKQLESDDRNCGAEINSNYSIFNKGYLAEYNNLYLLVSDTKAGEKCGKILDLYYNDEFEDIEVITIEGLHHKNYKEFKLNGLRNLVMELAAIVYEDLRSSDQAVLNATGGFKAQIFAAGLTGQILGIPVFYMYEGFPEVVELPPLPVAFDHKLWLKNYNLIKELYDNEMIAKEKFEQKYDKLDPKIRMLIDQDKEYYYFNAVGILYHEGFYIDFERNKHNYLPPQVKDKDSLSQGITYEDMNNGKHSGLQNYLEKIYQEDYVKSIYTFYYNPNLPTEDEFRPDSKGDLAKVEGVYSANEKTTKFGIYTTAQSTEEQQAVCIDLINKYL
ncbi:MAG: putative CRISPR-associated protein [Bacillota bacterium]